MTHKSKFTQFLIFYMCQQNSNFSQLFLSFLMVQLQNTHLHPIVRRTSTLYLGSFLARADYIPINLLKQNVVLLSTWLTKYLEGLTKYKLNQANVDVHGVYYTVCQALLYVMCFRYRKLVEESNADFGQFFTYLRIEDILNNKLYPLNFCCSGVVEEFAEICENNGVSLVKDLLESSKGIVVPTISASGEENKLDSFFPFDPYLLKDSSKYINPFYTTWEDTAETDQDQSQEEEDSSVSSLAQEFMSFTPVPDHSFMHQVAQ